MNATASVVVAMATASVFTDLESKSVCRWTMKIGSVSYVICKAWLYRFLLVRGGVVQGVSSLSSSSHSSSSSSIRFNSSPGTPATTSARIERIVKLLTVCGILLFGAAVGAFAEGKIVDDPTWDQHCVLVAPYHLSEIMLVLDTGLSVAYVLIFVLALKEADVNLTNLSSKLFDKRAHPPSDPQRRAATITPSLILVTTIEPSYRNPTSPPISPVTGDSEHRSNASSSSPQSINTATKYQVLMRKHILLTVVSVSASVCSMSILAVSEYVDVARTLFLPCMSLDLAVNAIVLFKMTQRSAAAAASSTTADNIGRQTIRVIPRFPYAVVHKKQHVLPGRVVEL